MPNSDVSKAEFIKGLKEYGIDETTLGNLEYNVNRINMELLNTLKEAPELLNSPFGVEDFKFVGVETPTYLLFNRIFLFKIFS